MMGNLGTLQRSDSRGMTAGTSSVTSAIAHASAKTGVDFNYLVNQANVESSMNPNAKAKTSSASGLYQFIEQTWLRMVKTHGEDNGLGQYAQAIRQNRDGDFTVTDRRMRSTILNLRNDPKTASLMAAELATENNNYLKQTVGGDPSGTDLYLAHFLGAQGASNFLKSMQKNPWAPAASIFPEAAKSNRNVFYAQGRPLSLQQIYNKFDAKFDVANAAPGQSLAYAQNNVQASQPAPQIASSYNTADIPEVILPSASRWGNPDSGYHRTVVSRIRDAGIAALADTSSSGNNIGGFLSSPVDVMLMAQTTNRFAHEDNKRYNS